MAVKTTVWRGRSVKVWAKTAPDRVCFFVALRDELARGPRLGGPPWNIARYTGFPEQRRRGPLRWLLRRRSIGEAMVAAIERAVKADARYTRELRTTHDKEEANLRLVKTLADEVDKLADAI